MSKDHFDTLPAARRDAVRTALAAVFGRALTPGAPETKHILGKMFLASFFAGVAPPGFADAV